MIDTPPGLTERSFDKKLYELFVKHMSVPEQASPEEVDSSIWQNIEHLDWRIREDGVVEYGEDGCYTKDKEPEAYGVFYGQSLNKILDEFKTWIMSWQKYALAVITKMNRASRLDSITVSHITMHRIWSYIIPSYLHGIPIKWCDDCRYDEVICVSETKYGRYKQAAAFSLDQT